jgi:predicted peroxiredoxin
MPGRYVISPTHGPDDTDRATVAFVVANAAVASDKDTVVFLSIEGTRLSQKGVADKIHEEAFAPQKELMDNFAKAGGRMFVCSPCFKKRKLDENNLVAGAAVVGGAKLVEFMTEGACPSVSY